MNAPVQDAPPSWRSMLFTPAHIEKFVVKAHERGADAVILDLEDSVPEAKKGEARAGIAAAARQVSEQGTDVLVRINGLGEGGEQDLDALAGAPVSAVVLPKVESAATVKAAAEQLVKQGAEHIWLIAQIEHVNALPRLDEIATSSLRLLGMSLGSEDFSDSAGMTPMQETLFAPNQQVVFACRRAGIQPFGFPGSIAEYADMEKFKRIIELADQMGLVGAFCIHPAQVEPLNQAFSPSAEAVEHAQGLLEAYEQAQAEGRGAFSYQGAMVDAPVVARAREVLRRHAAAAKQ